MTKRVVPMIFVPDVRETIAWYEAVGFTLVGTHHDEDDEVIDWASLSYGDTHIMLSGGGRSSSEYRREMDLYIYTDDVDSLYERLKDTIEVHQAPQDTFYGTREFIARDNNRFWVTFGQQLHNSQTPEGE